MKFPCDKEQYILINTISTPNTSYTMSNANHVNLATGQVIPVGIKIFNRPENTPSFNQEIAAAEACDHQNIVKIHCTFMVNNRRWVITPPPRPSVRAVMHAHHSFRQGLPGYSVFLILRQTLEALNYMHDVQNKAHGNVGADYIFLNQEYSGVQLMPNILSYNTCRSESLYCEYPVNKVNDDGGTKSGDVWNFGLLALEIFYYAIPSGWRFQMLMFGMKYELEKIKRDRKQRELGVSGGSNTWRRKILGCFKREENYKMPPRPQEPLLQVVPVKMPRRLLEVVADCLSDDPAKRPTTKQLLGYELFRGEIPENWNLAEIRKAYTKSQRR